MLTNPRKNYLGLKYGSIGNYQDNLYPWSSPSHETVSFGEEKIAPQSDGGVLITNSFGMSPELRHHLTSMGIIGNYQENLYPLSSHNHETVSFGKKKVKKYKGVAT